MSAADRRRDLLPIATLRHTAGLVWVLVGARRRTLAIMIGTFAGAGLCGAISPWVLGRLVDDVRAGSDSGALTHAFVIIAVASVLGGVLTAASISWLARSGEPALAALRERVLDRALHLDSERVERAGLGDVLSRVGDDVRIVADALGYVIPALVGSVVAIVFTALGLFTLDWRLGLAGLAAVPMYALSLHWYLPRSNPYYKRERIAQGERAEVLVSGMHGAATLRAYRAGAAHVASINHHSRKAMDISIDVFALFGRFAGRNNRAELVGLLLILGTGFALVDNRLATVGAVTAAALYFHRLFNPVGTLVMLFDQIQSVGASLTRLAGVALLPEPPHRPAPPLQESPDVRLRSIRHSYDGEHDVVRDVDLVVAPGERVALVGATGAGKTTLAAIAAGVIAPARGTVELGGVALTELDADTLRSQVALLSQDVHVFTGTLRENLLLGDEHATDDELHAALATTRSMPWVRALPAGLSTRIGDHGHRITAAQAQQIALARIELLDPTVVILDEATAEAGSAGAAELERAALAVIGGRTAIVVAHRLTQAESADRILVMEDGRVVEEGMHDELVKTGGRYATLWEAWSTA